MPLFLESPVVVLLPVILSAPYFSLGLPLNPARPPLTPPPPNTRSHPHPHPHARLPTRLGPPLPTRLGPPCAGTPAEAGPFSTTLPSLSFLTLSFPTTSISDPHGPSRRPLLCLLCRSRCPRPPGAWRWWTWTGPTSALWIFWPCCAPFCPRAAALSASPCIPATTGCRGWRGRRAWGRRCAPCIESQWINCSRRCRGMSNG